MVRDIAAPDFCAVAAVIGAQQYQESNVRNREYDHEYYEAGPLEVANNYSDGIRCCSCR